MKWLRGFLELTEVRFCIEPSKKRMFNRKEEEIRPLGQSSSATRASYKTPKTSSTAASVEAVKPGEVSRIW